MERKLIKEVPQSYLYSKFPESLFACTEDTIEYNKRIAKGVEVAAKSNVVITGLCRDIINVLDHWEHREKRR